MENHDSRRHRNFEDTVGTDGGNKRADSRNFRAIPITIFFTTKNPKLSPLAADNQNAMKRIFFALCFFFIFASTIAFAADAEFIYSGSENYSLVERTDLRRYDNGKYSGLVVREIRSFIVCDGGVYDGDFYVSQDTVRNKQIVEEGIHTSIHSVFKIHNNGKLEMLEDNGFPTFRSFPTFPNQKIQIGQSWQAEATRCVDPLNKGIPTCMPIFVEYTYLKDEIFQGEEVFVLSAKWATRYGNFARTNHVDYSGDSDLQKAQGSHNATMYIRKSDCAALVIRDSVDETFFYSDGNQYSFKGTISLFTEYPPAVDKTKLIPALRRAELIDDDAAKFLADKNSPSQNSGTKNVAKNDDEKNPNKKNSLYDKLGNDSNNPNRASVSVEKTSGGIKLTIQNLHFKPDSPELLPGEENLLDKIASVLKQAPKNKLLIEGHTADTGNPKGEMQLSVERSRAIAQELSKRGINPDLFLCRGSGSKKPIVDNSTREGMAKNRRVEITILE